MKIIDLKNVLITDRVQQSWLVYLPIAVNDLRKKYHDLKPSEVADEQLRINDDGTSEIFVKVRNSEIKMRVSSDEYSIK